MKKEFDVISRSFFLEYLFVYLKKNVVLLHLVKIFRLHPLL